MESERKGNAPGAISRRDGRGDTVEAVAGVDRAHYPKAGKVRRPLALDKMLMILRFRHLLEKHDLTAAVLKAMKGKFWYFGMKLHVGTDCKGRVHRVTAG